jgi:hypothetical protein
MLIDVAIPGDRNVIKKEAEKILKYKDLTIERKNKCNTSNNRGNWNHLKIIQKIPEQRTGNPRSQGATENSHIGHCTHTAESTNVKCNRFNIEASDVCTMNRNNRMAATLYSLGT